MSGELNIFLLITVIIIYLGAIFYLGYLGYKRTKSSVDYMLGGRNTHPYVMAMSYGATFISTSAIVGFGGVASFYGMSLLWLTVCNILVGIFIAFVFFGKRTRRMGLNLDAHTFPELLGKRLDSKFIQIFTGIVIFILMPLYSSAVIIGGARFLEGLVKIPYVYGVAIFAIIVASYVIMGGLKGVMYTDALQGTIMVVGMIVLLVFMYIKLGGVVEAHQALTDMSGNMFAGFVKQGLSGWTVAPEFGSPLWYTIFTSLVLGVGIGVLAQPQLVVRYMTVKSDKELNRAVIIGGVFILLTVGTPFVVGSLSNVYFNQHPILSEKMVSITNVITNADGIKESIESSKIILTNDTAFKVSAIVGGKPNPDTVIPAIINVTMPDWFGYLFMLAILAAAMSTLSSQFHTMGTAIGRDVYSKIVKTKDNSKQGEVWITKIGIIVTIIITVLLSLTIGEGGIIARATAIFFGVMASSFLAPYAAAIFWKRLTKAGAIAGILSGITASAILFLFFHKAEASALGICNLLFGKPFLSEGFLEMVDPLVLALPISIIFTIVVSLLTKVHNPDTVNRSFEGIK